MKGWTKNVQRGIIFNSSQKLLQTVNHGTDDDNSNNNNNNNNNNIYFEGSNTYPKLQ